MSSCTYSDSTGHICKFPGVFSHSLHGSNNWRCVWHWRLLNDSPGPSEARMMGDEIVRQSNDWDGTRESYLSMRKAAGTKGAKGIRGGDGGNAGVASVPRPLSEMVWGVLAGKEVPEGEAYEAEF